jgi:hypothetical protein
MTGGKMAKNYKIKVKVEIEESDEETTGSHTETEDGQFEIVINEAQGLSIDDCEQALLRTNYPAIRAALAKHLSEVSKKKY